MPGEDVAFSWHGEFQRPSLSDFSRPILTIFPAVWFFTTNLIHTFVSRFTKFRIYLEIFFPYRVFTFLPIKWRAIRLALIAFTSILQISISI